MNQHIARGLAFAALAGAGAVVVAPTAVAQDAVPQSQGAGKQCVVHGDARMPTNLEIFDRQTGGEAIARFTGVQGKLAVTDFPATAAGRAMVQTGTGTGSFRIEGWIDASKVPLVTRQAVPVVMGHVWIGKHRDVELVSASPGRLRVQKKVRYPMSQTFSAWADCSAFTLTPSTPPGFEVPGKARGYVLKKDEITLYDDPGESRSAVTTIYNAGGNGVLFWSEKQRGAYVHVQYSGEVVLEAWAPRRDLSALPRGETMDQPNPARYSQASPPTLKVAGTPRVVKTTKEVPIRRKPTAEAAVIGRIEADTEVLVVDVVVGYASVLPSALNVAPAGENHFWADAKELGL